VHRYADAVCRRDAEQWASCWADDSEWMLDAERQVHGRDAIVEQWTIEMAKYAAVLQLVANGDASVDGDVARGRWYIHEHNRRADGSNGSLIAYYDDVYQRVDGDWRFRRRELTRLYQGPPNLSGTFAGRLE
jgi:ketosteroid isomerase-like protein